MTMNKKYPNYSVYVLTNTVNDKQYIGMTKRPHRRIIEHLSSSNNRLVKTDTKRFDKDAFLFEVLAYNMTKAQALDLESKLCSEINPAYNAPITGRKRDSLRGKNNPAKRPEVRAKISAALKGENNPAKRPEVRAKISDSCKGRPAHLKSPEERSKISKALRLPQQKIDHIRYLCQNRLPLRYIASICQVGTSSVYKYTKGLRSSKT